MWFPSLSALPRPAVSMTGSPTCSPRIAHRTPCQGTGSPLCPGRSLRNAISLVFPTRRSAVGGRIRLTVGGGH